MLNNVKSLFLLAVLASFSVADLSAPFIKIGYGNIYAAANLRVDTGCCRVSGCGTSFICGKCSGAAYAALRERREIDKVLDAAFWNVADCPVNCYVDTDNGRKLNVPGEVRRGGMYGGGDPYYYDAQGNMHNGMPTAEFLEQCRQNGWNTGGRQGGSVDPEDSDSDEDRSVGGQNRMIPESGQGVRRAIPRRAKFVKTKEYDRNKLRKNLQSLRNQTITQPETGRVKPRIGGGGSGLDPVWPPRTIGGGNQTITLPGEGGNGWHTDPPHVNPGENGGDPNRVIGGRDRDDLRVGKLTGAYAEAFREAQKRSLTEEEFRRRQRAQQRLRTQPEFPFGEGNSGSNDGEGQTPEWLKSMERRGRSSRFPTEFPMGGSYERQMRWMLEDLKNRRNIQQGEDWTEDLDSVANDGKNILQGVEDLLTKYAKGEIDDTGMNARLRELSDKTRSMLVSLKDKGLISPDEAARQLQDLETERKQLDSGIPWYRCGKDGVDPINDGTMKDPMNPAKRIKPREFMQRALQEQEKGKLSDECKDLMDQLGKAPDKAQRAQLQKQFRETAKKLKDTGAITEDEYNEGLAKAQEVSQNGLHGGKQQPELNKEQRQQKIDELVNKAKDPKNKSLPKDEQEKQVKDLGKQLKDAVNNDGLPKDEAKKIFDKAKKDRGLEDEVGSFEDIPDDEKEPATAVTENPDGTSNPDSDKSWFRRTGDFIVGHKGWFIFGTVLFVVIGGGVVAAYTIPQAREFLRKFGIKLPFTKTASEMADEKKISEEKTAARGQKTLRSRNRKART